MLDAISRFVQASPMSVIVRGLMERVDPRHRHVSTARLLAQAKNSP
ncbi:hypothetical protein NIES2098_21830 [Calothrix sp. NIES-2098]|nr:hypothetical protein NIES2098_21830 [Calothrix sp. NIES-2098]